MMGDISTWNPVDNSNTTAPPDGWPEGMAPSAVNNAARAMMGAVRRWYDTVTAQLASLTTSLGNYLPLAGGTMTGALTAPQLTSTGNLNVNGAAFVNSLGSSTTVNGTTATFSGTCTAAQLTSTGNINAAGTVTAAQLTSTGNINAAGTVTGTSFIGNVSVPASGPVTTGGTVTGGQLTSTGNINAAGGIAASGDITGANLVAGSNVYVAGHPALSVSTAGRLDILTPSGDLALVIYGNPTWQTSYFNNTHQFGNSGRDFTYATFGIAGCFNVSGTWGTFSDASLKDDISPYDRGLAAILELSPISYRYLPGTPFADPERTMRYGLVAQDVAGIIPEMVGETTLVEGEDAVGTVFPGHLVFVLVNAVKELAARDAALTARVEALESVGALPR